MLGREIAYLGIGLNEEVAVLNKLGITVFFPIINALMSVEETMDSVKSMTIY